MTVREGSLEAPTRRPIDWKNPEFYDEVCWAKLATWGSQYLKKGTRVLVSGYPRIETYEKDDGSKRRRFRLVADRIELIG